MCQESPMAMEAQDKGLETCLETIRHLAMTPTGIAYADDLCQLLQLGHHGVGLLLGHTCVE